MSHEQVCGNMGADSSEPGDACNAPGSDSTYVGGPAMADVTRSLTPRLRFEILRRDGHRCHYCGGTPEDGLRLTVDHVLPVALGGITEPSNLVTACDKCNGGKSSTAPDQAVVAAVDERAAQMAEAMERAAEIERSSRADPDAHDVVVNAFLTEWMATAQTAYGSTWRLPHEWESSILTFHRHGMSIDDLLYTVAVTVRRNPQSEQFRYFCGVAWKIIRDRRELALALMEDEK